MSISRSLRIGIIGAGVSGLTTARALNQAGFKNVSVFEALDRVGDNIRSSQGVILAANAVTHLDKLDLGAPVYQSSIPISIIRVLNRAGHALSTYNPANIANNYLRSLPSTPRISTVMLHHRTLIDILLKHHPSEVPINTQHELTNISHKTITSLSSSSSHHHTRESEEITLTFSSNKSVAVDFLIGADGFNSSIRRLMDPTAAFIRKVGGIWIRGVSDISGVAHPSELAPPGELIELWGNGVKFIYSRISKKEIYYFATVNQQFEGELIGVPHDEAHEENLKKNLPHVFSNFAPVVPFILGTTTSVSWGTLEDSPPSSHFSTSSPSCALVGDSIHSSLPDIYQGISMCIESAVALALCMAEHDRLEDAMRRYSSVRFPRTSHVNLLAMSECEAGIKVNKVLSVFRDIATGMMPPTAQRQSSSSILGYDVYEDF